MLIGGPWFIDYNMMGKDVMEHYDFGDPIIIHNELQKALGKAKINKAIRVDTIPNEIISRYSHLVKAFMLLISSMLYLYIYMYVTV